MIYKKGGIFFQSFKPKKPEKELISVRIDKNLLKAVDQQATKNEISLNEFIIQSIVYAMKHIMD